VRSSAGSAAGWTAAFLAGGVWGVTQFSWGLPLSLPVRYGATVLLVVTLAAASRNGRLAAGAFTLGMGASSSFLLASSGLLFADWWGVVPAAAFLAGVFLHAWVLLRNKG
jgi:hypothetical protein